PQQDKKTQSRRVRDQLRSTDDQLHQGRANNQRQVYESADHQVKQEYMQNSASLFVRFARQEIKRAQSESERHYGYYGVDYKKSLFVETKLSLIQVTDEE